MSTTSSINSLLSSTGSTGGSALDLSSMLAAETGSSSSGIDVTAAVTAALYADRAPERLWQADVATFSSQTTALTAIQTATAAFANDLQSLNTIGGTLASRTVASSNSSYVTATAVPGTKTDTHTVVVNTLATKGAWYSDLASSPKAILPTSSMTLTTSLGAITIATGAGEQGDNLNDIAAAINGAKLGVTATVLSDTTGSRVAIVSNATGKANGFSITSQDYTGTSWTSPDLISGSTLGANTVTLSNADGATLTVASTSGDSYEEFAAAINQAVADYNKTAPKPLNVTATAGSDSNGTNLSITSTDGSSFKINEPAFGFTQSNAATDASTMIDGAPVYSATNTISGAIQGVTVNLMGITQGATVQLAVTPAVSQISGVISQLVTDYNSAINLVNAQFKVSTSTDSSGKTTSSQGVLASDSTVRSLQSALESALGYKYTPSTGSTSVATLGDIGITMNNDGTLSLDTTKLETAVSDAPDDVQTFFEGTALNGFASNFYSALKMYTTPANGAFTVDLQSIQAQSNSLTQQISNFELGYIASQQAILTSEFSKAEIALQSLPQQMQMLNAQLGFTGNSNR